MRLAIRNIAHDRTHFVLTVAGITFSALMMIFQGSLLAGFERAASRIIDSIDADIWVTARGVQAFDYSNALPGDPSELVQGAPGVASVQRVTTGMAFWQCPNGTRKNVLFVGAASGFAGEYPVAPGTVLLPEHVIVDASDMETLGLEELPAGVEINGRRYRVEYAVSGFGSFLGSPYVFTTLRDVRRGLGLPEDMVTFLTIHVQPGRSIPEVLAAMRDRTPEYDILTKQQFASRTKSYWLTQTGAGGALLTAALLGFVVGMLIVSQTVYATTMENLDEFATLKALGASRFFIVRVVLVQALLSTVLGFTAGTLVSLPVMQAARKVVAWIYTPWELLAALGATAVVLAALASIIAVRAALGVEPGRVFGA